MLKLADVVPSVKGVLEVTLKNNVEVKIPFSRKTITAAIREMTSKKGLEELSNLNKTRKALDENAELPTILPKNVNIQQLTMVMESLEIEIEDGKQIDPTDYDQMCRLPEEIIQALYDSIFGTLSQKKRARRTLRVLHRTKTTSPKTRSAKVLRAFFDNGSQPDGSGGDLVLS